MSASSNIPQADSLPHLRTFLEFVDTGLSVADSGARADLSERHTAYYARAAQTLGLLDAEDSVTELGRELLATPTYSPEERNVWERAIQSSVELMQVAPNLLKPREPTTDSLARGIRQHSALSPATAERRAETLLRWRKHLLQLPLPMPAQPTSKTPPVTLARSARAQLVQLDLENFKGFHEASLEMGRFSVVVGTNAAGKSNLRDALRFLHGIARGYPLAEIIGEKYVEGGVLQWKGIRGGTREATYQGGPTFALTAHVDLQDGATLRRGEYRIEVEVARDGRPPRVRAERLVVDGRGQFIFDSHPSSNAPKQDDSEHLHLRLKKEAAKGFVGPLVTVLNATPAITQLLEKPRVPKDVRQLVDATLDAFRSMRFLDLSQDAMRIASIPGQIVLGDRGENLSSVLHAICGRPQRKQALIEWVRELTPLDVVDFEFPTDASGKVLVVLVEQGGRKTSAFSASDGTLRFLALIAAFLGPEPANLYFFEELETGLHPARLHLVVNLIERQTKQSQTRVVASTHSPALLGFLSETTLKYTTLAYRLHDAADQRLVPILRIEGAKQVLARKDIAKLHADGWLENAVEFAASEKTG